MFSTVVYWRFIHNNWDEMIWKFMEAKSETDDNYCMDTCNIFIMTQDTIHLFSLPCPQI